MQIFWLREWLPVVTGLLTLWLFYTLQSSYHPERLVLKAYRELSGLLQKRERDSGWYKRTESWLTRNGGAFHYGSWVNPIRLLAVRLLLALTGLAVLGSFGTGYGLGAFIGLFFLPTLLLGYMNKRDNERLLPELKLVYHALEIQIRAGVYVTDALAECYGSVQDRRLRKALLDLAGDIVMKADIYEALERFQGSFDNRYVDSLCITLLQALESGQALELLGDIGEQLKDMEQTVLERKKAALDRSVTFYQLGVLSVVLGIALYACMTYMFRAAAGF